MRIASDFDSVYAEHSELLKSIAIRKFRVPDYDAEALVQEVFISYFGRGGEVPDLNHWLIGAISNASRYYWRKHGRNTEQLSEEFSTAREDPATANILESLPASLAAREILARLPPRYHDILRMRYFEGYSVKEIAEHLGVTSKYTQKLIAKSLRRAEQLLGEVHRAPRIESESQELREVVAGFVEAYQKVG